MVIKGLGEERLLEDVEETLKTSEKVRMKLNLGKCTFGVEEGQFLGYYVTQERIQPNLVMVGELMIALSPYTLKDAQVLNSKLKALNRFISKLADKSLPLFQMLKGCIEKNNFQWTPVAETALRHLKEVLHRFPTLASPISSETLQVYLAASNEAISSVLAVDREGKQLLVYFVSRAL